MDFIHTFTHTPCELEEELEHSHFHINETLEPLKPIRGEAVQLSRILGQSSCQWSINTASKPRQLIGMVD